MHAVGNVMRVLYWMYIGWENLQLEMLFQKCGKCAIHIDNVIVQYGRNKGGEEQQSKRCTGDKSLSFDATQMLMPMLMLMQSAAFHAPTLFATDSRS